MPRLVLVPSPFVGAQSWQATAGRLTDAVVADYGELSGPDWYERPARVAAAAADGRPWIAVLHSGAGGFAPALAEASADLRGFIFVDAVLPYPGSTCLETAPAPLVERLRSLTTDGRLAPWNAWFDEDPLPRLVPDPEVRAAMTASLPRTPFAFLEVRSPASDAWVRLPSAYLQFSRNYESFATRVEAQGWTVARTRRHHLAMVSDPQAVADMLADLAARLAP